MAKAVTVPLPSPPVPCDVTRDVVESGRPVPPIDRIKLFSDTEWEDFVLEWADSLRQQYSRVECRAGPGDMGRDIIAFLNEDDAVWDNYQCKHYKDPLQPSQIWVELGKLVYYTNRGDFNYPRRYYFVAPHGAGTKLSNLLKNPVQLRRELISNWDNHCRSAITSVASIELDEDFLAYLNSLDFSIFDAIPPLKLIEQHARTNWHFARFGGGLPARPAVPTPPADPSTIEANYVQQLLEAYSDHLKRLLSTIVDIAEDTRLLGHFVQSRREFYSAESLRAFSRDTLPPGEFERLQDEVLAGIGDAIRADHIDGYRRVVAVVKTARDLQITSHPLPGILVSAELRAARDRELGDCGGRPLAYERPQGLAGVFRRIGSVALSCYPSSRR